MSSFKKLIICSFLLLLVNSLPIDNEKPGVTVNDFNREINNVLKKDINEHLAEVVEQSGSDSKPKDIVDKLNNDDRESDVKIQVTNFTSVVPTDLTFTKVSDKLEVVTKFSNSTFTQLKIQEKVSEDNTSKNSTDSEEYDSSEESGSGSEESFGCDAAALDEAVKLYYATTVNVEDSENDTETTTPSSSTIESNIFKISSSKSASILTTSTEISTKIEEENDSESSSKNIPESSSSSSSTTESSTSTEQDQAMEVMKKIQEVAADPVIFTQGV